MEEQNIHSSFLHLWQKKSLDIENGGPAENADAIRFKLGQLQVLKRETSTIDDYAVASQTQKLLQQYGRLMDSSEKDGGLNNYADPILFLIGNSRNESKEWTSKLKISDIVEKYFPAQPKSSVTMAEEYKKLADLLNKSNEFKVGKTLAKGKAPSCLRDSDAYQDEANLQPTLSLFDPWDVEQDGGQDLNRDPQLHPPVLNGLAQWQREGCNSVSNSSSIMPVTQGRGGGRGGQYPWAGADGGGLGDTHTRGSDMEMAGRRGGRVDGGINSRGGSGTGYGKQQQGRYDERDGYGYPGAEVMGGSDGDGTGNNWRGRGTASRQNGRAGWKSAERGQGKYPWTRRGEEGRSGGRWMDNDDRTNASYFKTASHQLAIEQQKKFGRGGGLAEASYGSGRRSLGVRRSINTKFVPPIRREDEDNYGSEVVQRCMPQASGGRGGGGEREDSPYAYLMADDRLKNIEPKMVELIMHEIMDSGLPVTWDDIAGLTLAKATIQEIVVWPMLRPDIFTGLRGPPKGLLLFGPPGTGKTMIGKCIACQSGSTFFSISASSLTSKWVGEGEKMVRAMFAVARCHQPAVIFIDEIDSLLTQRSDTEHESSRRIKTEFLVQLDGATTGGEERLLVVGATNRPQELDEAARRRLVKKLYIPLPDQKARQQIIEKLLKDQCHSLERSDIERICSLTEGYSGADMANLCREAALGPIRSINFAEIHCISVDQVRAITVNDFLNALSSIKASVSDRDLQTYEDWNNKFGISAR